MPNYTDITSRFYRPNTRMTNKHRAEARMPIKGLHTDNEPFYQPEGFGTYALNAVNDSIEGSQASLVNEPGNEACFTLPAGYKVWGAEVIEEDIVIFSSDGTNSEIGVVTNCTYTTIVNDTCFNFRRPISTTHRVIRGCERVVYFVDGINPDKQFNLDRLEDYQTGGMFDCNLFLIQRDFTIPCITPAVSTGSLEEGSYQFAIRYEDNNGNIVGYSPLTQQYITDEKSRFVLNLTGLDTTVENYRLVVYQNQRTFLSYRIAISEADSTFYFTTLLDFTEISIDEVLIPQSNYETSLAIEQVQNRLLRANVTEKDRDYAAINQFSNNLAVTWESVAIEEDQRTLMRDEVYALGIMYKFNDGTFSPVFHIHADTTNGTSSSSQTVNIAAFASDFTLNYNSLTGAFDFSATNVPDGYTIRANFEADGFPYQATGTNMTGGVATVAGAGTGLVADYTSYDFTVTLLRGATVVDTQNFILTDATTGGTDVLNTTLNFPAFNSTVAITTANTATATQLGAHQCANATYQNPDCAVDYWGALNGQPITHHRMPNLDLAPLVDYTGGGGRQGIQLNIVVPAYPDPDIVGHYIMFSKQERTILEKGIINNTYTEATTGNSNFSYKGVTSLVGGDDTSYAYYTSPSQLFTINDVELTNLEKIGNYTLNNSDTGCISFDGDGNPVFGTEVDTKLGKRVYTGNNFTSDVFNLSMADQEYYFTKDFRSINGDVVVNTSLTNDFVMGSVSTPINVGALEMGYVAAKSGDEVYCAIENIRYEVAHDCCLTPGTANVIPQHVYVTDMNFTNIAQGEVDSAAVIKAIVKIGAIVAAVGAATVAVAAAPVIGGAVAGAGASSAAISTAVAGVITQAAVAGGTALVSKIAQGMSATNATLFFSLLNNEALSDFIVASGGDFDGDFGGGCNGAGITFDFTSFYAEYLRNVFVESEYNMNFRDRVNVSGCPSYYDGSYDLLTYLEQKVLLYNENGDDDPYPNPLPCVEEYNYNPNYLVRNPQLFNALTPEFYDLCSDCNGEFPNRIVYSPISLDSDRSDFYRVNRANDFKDVPAHRGPITSIKYENNTLYVHTDDSTFIIQPNPRTLQTSEETVFIGDGSFLAIPPQEMIQADVSAGGMQSVTGSCSSEGGYVWVDEKNGHVFHAGKGRISDKGMMRFFREKLPSNLRANLTAAGMNDDVRLDLTQVTYDPNYKRFIFRVFDYDPLFTFDVDPAVPAQNYFDTAAKVFRNVGGTELDYNDATLFENLSFTISYSVLYDSWTSFHSYLPDYMYFDNDRFYTVVNNSSWSHLKLNSHTNFYGTKYDYVIEYVDNGADTFSNRSIQWFGHSYLYDATNKKWVEQDLTFDRMWVYDDCQSTGLQSLVIDQDNATDFYSGVINWSTTNPRITKTDDVWRVSQIRDNIGDRALNPASCEWAQIQGSYPIDNVFNAAAHDFAASQYEQPKITSKWVKVRFYANPATDIRIVTNLFIDKNKTSIR